MNRACIVSKWSNSLFLGPKHKWLSHAQNFDLRSKLYMAGCTLGWVVLTFVSNFDFSSKIKIYPKSFMQRFLPFCGTILLNFHFFTIYLLNRAFFSIIQLWCLLSPEPLVPLYAAGVCAWASPLLQFSECFVGLILTSPQHQLQLLQIYVDDINN